ncbi:Histone-lysine N-methyltransferase ATX1 [Acorus calamus]|uniref:Histone-lysine N-methyltransferase ATX1 n=1 Tax=Acorus calamus TaxID=4465 RepID=A0AAV9C9H3_ACOCL|nr:Histone-lysine N-methyltransferase ATX1 [Acorus calamus]
MENNKSFHDLPLLKRYKLLHQSSPLPTPTTYTLPAKKRVWALGPGSPLPLIDDEPEPKKLNLNLNEHPPEEEPKPTDDDDDGISCAVCGSTDGDPTDPIVFCDGCDLMVHATCYGDPLTRGVPDGDWLCSRCGSDDVTAGYDCCLCPMKGGGPTKPTVDGRWAHVLCAVLVPEVFFRDAEGREGIDCSEVPKERWMGRCYVCGVEGGGCVIECSEPKCGLGFHVSCGVGEELCIEYREGRGRSGGVVAGFCHDHTQLWKKQQLTGKFKIVPRERDAARKTKG